MQQNLWLVPIVVSLILFPTVMVPVSYLTGWRKLLERYSLESPTNNDNSKTYTFQHLSLGIFRYKTCINFRISELGFSFEPFILFRFFHPPIFIKWTDILTMGKTKTTFGQKLMIQLEEKTIYVYNAVAEEIYKSKDKTKGK